MSKIKLIIAREYTTRVYKKSFILLTFLTPILFAALFAVPVWLAQIKNTETKEIVVIDHSKSYQEAFVNDDVYHFTFCNETLEEEKKKERDNSLTGILLISGDLTQGGSATMYAETQIDLETKIHIERLLSEYIESQKLASYQIPNLQAMIAEAETDVHVDTIRWTKDGDEQKGSAEMALILGMVTAFIIYMFIVMYGGQVMSGVVQEKTNRIVEVIVSSVKPFELMMGKIIGIALVGLTQIFLWVVLTLILTSVLTLILGSNQIVNTDNQEAIQMVYEMSNSLNLGSTLLYFLVYFLGGYLLYASLFAAVGSAVENETDTQQFSLPLTIPIIFAIYAAIYSAENPDGPLAFWCSMIPFTSPIVMMVRLPYGVPGWQIILSILTLVVSFIGSTWVAGKIYRTGVLMYGKKITWKELWKWLKYS
jgi:ABC-2 type transport system permease protein